MSEWTKGPWRKRVGGNIGNLIEAYVGPGTFEPRLDNGYRSVATYQACGHFTQADDEEANHAANGDLIAAAPDLYEALSEARERMQGSSPAIKALAAKTDAALAKARGETDAG